MASFFPYAQHLLGTGLFQSQGAVNASSSSNGCGCSGDVSHFNATSDNAMPGDLSSWLAFLFSFSALRDWAKIFVFGTILETVRRRGLWIYHYTIKSMFVTAHFTQHDTSYSM